MDYLAQGQVRPSRPHKAEYHGTSAGAALAERMSA